MLTKCYVRKIQPVKCTESICTCLEPMAIAVVWLKGPFCPGIRKIPTDISLASVLSDAGTTMLVPITAERQTCASRLFALSRQLKYMHPFPFLHLYWLIGRADVPRSHPHGTLTPSCHSNDNSFIYRHRCRCRADRLAGPGQLHHSLAQPPIHLYLHCQFPKFHLPIICTFSPSITIPASTSLSLICFSYSLSDLSLPFQRNLLLFTASTSPSASCQPQHFFLTRVKPRTVCPVQMGLTSQDFVSNGLINITVSAAPLHCFSRVLFLYHCWSWFYAIKCWSRELVKGQVERSCCKIQFNSWIPTKNPASPVNIQVKPRWHET